MGERPVFLSKGEAEKLKRRGAHVVDILEDQKKELAAVKNPSVLRGNAPRRIVSKDMWVYFPWRNSLVRILDRKNFELLRRSRNEFLISREEQQKLGKARIAIAGLNVGNPAAICMALEGIGSEMRFADNDILSVSNLNRFRAGLPDLGLNKAVLSARQAYETNPFLNLKIYPTGINPENIDEFLLGPKVNVLVEEMDNLKLKIEIRERARKYRIPVVMVTGNGENVIIDVERFDTNPKLPLMSGYLKPKIIDVIKNAPAISFEEKVRLARDFMGAQYLTKRLAQSFSKIGKEIAGIPQIAESSFLRGASVAYVVRRIITGAPVHSGRYYLRLDKVLK